MAFRVIIKNGSIFFIDSSLSSVTVGGQTFNTSQWYDNVTIDYTWDTTDTSYLPAFGLESGNAVANGKGNYGTDIDNYPAGYASHYKDDGTADYSIFGRATFDGRQYMLGQLGTGIYLFHGDGSDTPSEYTTTLSCQYVTIDGSTFSSSNCSVYYGDLTNKATITDSNATFTTPDGGGECKIWFCKPDSTDYYTFSYMSIGGEDVTQNSDGSFTVTLESGEDTELSCIGTCKTVTKYNIELVFDYLTIDGVSVSSSSDLIIGYHFDTSTETKVQYTGHNISIEYTGGLYTDFYMTFYTSDNKVYNTSSLSIVGSDWIISDNVMTLSLSGDESGRIIGNITTPTSSYTLTISDMLDNSGLKFIETYSGAVLTYTPTSGSSYTSGNDFTVTCAISGGWKFDTTGGGNFCQTISGSSSSVSSDVTFVDEYTITGTVDGSLVNAIVWFENLVGLKDSEPEPEYMSFITPYLPTKADINKLAGSIWVDSSGSEITAMANILSYKEIFDTLDSDKTQTLMLGGYSSGITCKYLVDYTFTRNLGSVDIEEYWHNADDYNNTTIKVYIPLVGLVDVETTQVMGHKIYLEYRYEIIDGRCLAILYTDNYSPESIIYQSSCNFAIDEPINSNDYNSYSNSYWNILTNQLGDLKPFVLIDRKQPANDVVQATGNKVQIVKKVKECSGYTEFELVFMNDIECTNSEYGEIENLLTSGVII